MTDFKIQKMLKFISKQAVCTGFLISISHSRENLVLAEKAANLSVQLVIVTGSHQSVLLLLTFWFVKFVSHLRKECLPLACFSYTGGNE